VPLGVRDSGLQVVSTAGVVASDAGTCIHIRDAKNNHKSSNFPILETRSQVKASQVRSRQSCSSVQNLLLSPLCMGLLDEPATALSRLVHFWEAQAAETTQKWPRCRAAPRARTASVDGGAPDEPRHQGGPSCESRPGMQMRRGCARQSGPRRRDTILRWPQRGPRTCDEGCNQRSLVAIRDTILRWPQRGPRTCDEGCNQRSLVAIRDTILRWPQRGPRTCDEGCNQRSLVAIRDTILRWPQRGPRTARAARPMWGEAQVVSGCMQRAAWRSRGST